MDLHSPTDVAWPERDGTKGQMKLKELFPQIFRSLREDNFVLHVSKRLKVKEV